MPPAELPHPCNLSTPRIERVCTSPIWLDPLRRHPSICFQTAAAVPPHAPPFLLRSHGAASVSPMPGPSSPADTSLHCQLSAFSDLATADRVARQSRPGAAPATILMHGLHGADACLSPRRAMSQQERRVSPVRRQGACSAASPTVGKDFVKVFEQGCVRCHFECFGEILEVIVIAHKDTGRSKGGRFEAKPAIRACLGPYPVIDGQRANCNLACLGVQRSKAPQPTASKSICRSNPRDKNNNDLTIHQVLLFFSTYVLIRCATSY